jgi:ABC-type branched-subunit amino acid transport system substrate-binding protein
VLVARSAYGDAFVAGAKPVLTAAGANVTVQRYDPTAARFGRPVRKVAAVGPDAVVLVGGEESAAVVEAMVAEGLAPNG